MIRIDRDRDINPAFVAFMAWDRRHYVNGSDNVLVVTMHDGTQHRIKDESCYLGGADPYAIEKAILAALAAGGAA